MPDMKLSERFLEKYTASNIRGKWLTKTDAIIYGEICSLESGVFMVQQLKMPESVENTLINKLSEYERKYL